MVVIKNLRPSLYYYAQPAVILKRELRHVV
jgi:hypothetical protein